LFFTLLSIVVGLAYAETGLAENVVLAALGGVMIWLAGMVRRIGRGSIVRSV
jgi:hypothetical protein